MQCQCSAKTTDHYCRNVWRRYQEWRNTMQEVIETPFHVTESATEKTVNDISTLQNCLRKRMTLAWNRSLKKKLARSKIDMAPTVEYGTPGWKGSRPFISMKGGQAAETKNCPGSLLLMNDSLKCWIIGYSYSSPSSLLMTTKSPGASKNVPRFILQMKSQVFDLFFPNSNC